MIGRNDLCWCKSGKKWKKCHYPDPSQQDLSTLYEKKYGIILKTEEEIEGIFQANQLAAKILDEACQFAKKGVTTNQIDALVSDLHKKAGATAAALHYGYPPFPKSICTSVNDVICHGIPNDTPLQEGDIVNIDVATIFKGYYGDCSRMVIIGQTTPERKKVCDVSYECLKRAIQICRPGTLIKEIGEVIEKYAQSQGCSVVYQFVGHGVGIDFHEAPQVPHNRNNLSIPLTPGMTFTIEPMINAGKPEAIIDKYNHWEARTPDGQPSAQWEHTILITEEGCKILTLLEEDHQ